MTASKIIPRIDRSREKNSSKHRRTHRSAARWKITTCQSSHLPPSSLSLAVLLNLSHRKEAQSRLAFLCYRFYLYFYVLLCHVQVLVIYRQRDPIYWHFIWSLGKHFFFLLFMLTTLSAEWLDCFLGSVHRYGQEFRPDLAFACQLKWRKAKCNRLSPCKRVQGENNASGDFAADLGGRRSTIGFVSTFLCLALW